MSLVDGAGVTEVVDDPEVAANIEITGSTAAEVAGACPIVGTGIAEAAVVTVAAALLLLLLPPLPFVGVAVAVFVNLTVNAEVLITIVLVALLSLLLLVNNDQSVLQTVYESRRTKSKIPQEQDVLFARQVSEFAHPR